jgi:hypothetical protein
LRDLFVGFIVALMVWSCPAARARPVPETGPRSFANDEAFLDYVQKQTFRFFWEEANPANGLIPDRSRPGSPCSIASVGFGLSAINIAIERGWVARTNGVERVLRTLQTLWNLPQGQGASGCAGNRGWFYHFLDMNSGMRAWKSELSTIDTALLMMGVIEAGQFFTSPTNSAEVRIRELAEALVQRIDWSFMLRTNDPVFSMDWAPETGYGSACWVGYNEASCLYLLGLGLESAALPAGVWDAWTRGYQWQETPSEGGFVMSPSLFTHQYSQVWIDFRGIADAYMRTRNSDYFENSRRATLAQRRYGMENPLHYPNYGANEWGFTACDGPGQTVNGICYAGYLARGAPAGFEDGTIAPTAAASSLPFAPDLCLAALRHLYDTYMPHLWTTHGFRDAYNIQAKWWAEDVVGIDQGPIVAMLENYRTGSTWTRMLRSPIIQRGLERAGFTAPPPDHVQAVVSAPDKVELSWHNNSAYETGFQVEASTNGTQFAVTAKVGAKLSRVSVPVTPSQNYWFRVRTTCAAGVSGYRETLAVNPSALATAASRGGVTMASTPTN